MQCTEHITSFLIHRSDNSRFIGTNESAVRMMDCPAYGEVTQHLQDVSNLNDDHTYEYIPFHREDHPEDHPKLYDQPVFPDYEQPTTT